MLFMLLKKVASGCLNLKASWVLYQPTEKGSWVSVVPIYPAHLGKDHQIRGVSCWSSHYDGGKPPFP